MVHVEEEHQTLVVVQGRRRHASELLREAAVPPEHLALADLAKRLGRRDAVRVLRGLPRQQHHAIV